MYFDQYGKDLEKVRTEEEEAQKEDPVYHRRQNNKLIGGESLFGKITT